MSEQTAEQVLAKAAHDIEEMCKERSRTAHHNDLAVTKPQLWVNVAQRCLHGQGVKQVMRETGVGQCTYWKINRHIAEIKNTYKEFLLDNIHANIDAVDDLKAEWVQKMRESGEMDPNAAKAYQNMTISNKIDHDRVNRINDGADHVVKQVTVTDEELDDTAAAARARIAQRAEAIDVEFEEVDCKSGNKNSMSARDIELSDRLEILRLTQPNADFPDSPFGGMNDG